MSIFIIAEAGVNHDGDFDSAQYLIECAKNAGADAVKFQLFRDRPEIEHLRMTEDQIAILADTAAHFEIEFMCTPFYVDAVKFLDPLVKRHKIASGWTKDRAIFNAAVGTGKQVIASLGMYEGQPPQKPSSMVDYLHCVSRYPCPDKYANLNNICMYSSIIGYSDHTVGTVACVAAAALGAQIIEKHITYNTEAKGPDHSCSAVTADFYQMVQDIRRVEVML